MRSIATRSRVFPIILCLGMLTLLPQPARADVGVPMLVLVWPASWLLLLLIVPLEAMVARRVFGCELRTALKTVTIANLVSTILGIPVTWGLLVLMEMVLGGGYASGLHTLPQKIYAVTLQSPWLVPYEPYELDLDWMLPCAAAVLCIPFFFMSVASEGIVMRGLRGQQTEGVTKWAWQANLLSYGLILLFLGLDLLLVLHKRGLF